MTPRQIAMLVGLAAVWGASFLFIRVAVPSLGPIVLVELRVALAGAALLLYARLRGVRGVRPRIAARWQGYLVLGTVNAAAPFVLLAAAELELEASLTAVLNALTPLAAALVGALWLGQRITALQAAGLVLGIAGVALVVGLAPLEVDGMVLLAVLACVGACLCYGFGAHLARRSFAAETPLDVSLGQLAASTLVLLPLVPFFPPSEAPGLDAWLCVLGFALLSTALAYLVYFRLLVELDATRALTVTFLVPVFGVLWGAAFLAEEIHLGTLVGGCVILLAVGLITGVLRRPALRPAGP